MTKQDLVRELAVSEHLHLSTAVKALDGLIRITKEALASGDSIFIRGFGTLQVVHRDQKPVHNFATGQAIILPAHKTVRFKPSPDLRAIVNPDTTPTTPNP